ncbi:hypothetical protein KJ885_02165 [Patescibacteria group bacterium]|nr:hypothetical protein [Patescibacteria group bacterium]
MISQQQYRFSLDEKKIKNLEMLLPQHQKLKTFISPATLNKVPKIYLIRYKSKVIYVGITAQSISNRLRYGLNAQGKNGYHGYKWKKIKEPLRLCIYTFKNDTEERVEAIEAEIVYLIRNKTGAWPEYQTEIHFHNATESEKKIAERIYNEI